MKTSAIFLPLLCALFQAQAAPLPEIQASRPPMPGCVWQPYQFAQLGVRLLYQDCTDPSAHYQLSQHGNWLEQHRPSDDAIFGKHRIVGVFHKPATQRIEDAIQQNFVNRIRLDNPREQAQARKYCRVVRSYRPVLRDANKITLTIVPTGSYLRDIQHQLQQAPRDYGCGEYGADQALSYFEYHPNVSTTRYLFVEVGMDEPLFDENSIELLTDR